MPFLFGKKNKQTKTIVLIDIGSASIGGAVLVHTKEGLSRIVYTTRKAMVFQEELNFERYIIALSETVVLVLENISKALKSERPDACFCSLSEPWCLSENRNILIQKDKQFVVTKNRVASVIKKDALVFEKKIREQYPKRDTVLIQSDASLIKLNGYVSQNPYGVFVKKMEIYECLSIAPQKALNVIGGHIEKIIKCRNTSFRSFSFVAVSAICSIFPNKKIFTFIDITGETTDIAIVRDGVIRKNISFSNGVNMIIRRIIANTNSTEEEVRSMLYLYLTKGLEGNAYSRIDGIIKNTLKEWAEEFFNTLKGVSEEKMLPRLVFFATDNEMSSFFKTAIEKEVVGVLQKNNLAVNLEAFFVEGKPKDSFVSYDKDVKKDVFLFLNSVFIRKII